MVLSIIRYCRRALFDTQRILVMAFLIHAVVPVCSGGSSHVRQDPCRSPVTPGRSEPDSIRPLAIGPPVSAQCPPSVPPTSGENFLGPAGPRPGARLASDPNAYPWYINRLPRAAELEAGVEPLRRLLGLLPGLRVVMLHGGSARDGWRRLVRRHPDAALQLEVVPTYHTSSQAFIGPPETRAARVAALRAAFARTARILQEPDHGL